MKTNRKGTGFGILEVIIATGILLTVSIGVMSIINNLMKSNLHGTQLAEATFLHSEIYSELRNEASCTESFRNQVVDTAYSDTSPTIKHVVNGTPPTVTDVFTVGQYYQTRKLTIQGMQMGEFILDRASGTYDYGKAWLNLTFDKSNSLGPQSIVRSVRLQVTRTASDKKLYSCVAIAGTRDIWKLNDDGSIYYDGGNVGIGNVLYPTSLYPNRINEKLLVLDGGNLPATIEIRSQTPSPVVNTPNYLVLRNFAGGDSATSFSGIITQVAQGTIATPAPVAANRSLGWIGGAGWDGSSFMTSTGDNNGPTIKFVTTEAFSPSRHGSKIIFSTIANGTPDPQPTLELENTIISSRTFSTLSLYNIEGPVTAPSIHTAVNVYNNTNVSGGQPAINFMKSRGTRAAPAGLQAGDIIASMGGFGYDGSSYGSAGGGIDSQILLYGAEANFTPGANGPTFLSLFTRPATAGAISEERLRIKSNGSIKIGVQSSAENILTRYNTNPGTIAIGFSDGRGVGMGQNSIGETGIGIDDGTRVGGQYYLAAGNGPFVAKATGRDFWIVREDAAQTVNKILTLSLTGLGIGISPAKPLHVAGDAQIDGALTASGRITANDFLASSDSRLKTDIKPLVHSLKKILSLDGVTFRMKNGSEQQIGLLAQDVERIFPESVRSMDDGFKAVSYSSLIAPVIEAIKELVEKIKALSTELGNLKSGRISQLEAENTMLKQYLCAKDPVASFCNTIMEDTNEFSK